MAITETVYLGRDNRCELEISRNDTLIPWAGVTRMLLTLEHGATAVVVDSDVQPDALSWQTPGKLMLKLGSVGLTPARYAARLIVFDPTHPNGQVLIDGYQPHALLFDVRSAP